MERDFVNNAMSGYITRHKDTALKNSIHTPKHNGNLFQPEDTSSQDESHRSVDRLNLTYGGTSRTLNEARDLFGKINGGTLQSCL